jgi:hypothetical protein
MSAETLLVILVVGPIAGWLAGQAVKGTGCVITRRLQLVPPSRALYGPSSVRHLRHARQGVGQAPTLRGFFLLVLRNAPNSPLSKHGKDKGRLRQSWRREMTANASIVMD